MTAVTMPPVDSGGPAGPSESTGSSLIITIAFPILNLGVDQHAVGRDEAIAALLGVERLPVELDRAHPVAHHQTRRDGA